LDGDVSELTFDEVKADSLRYGPIAYLATASRRGTPYVSPVAVAWVDDEVAAFLAADEAKVANLRANPQLCVHYAVGESTGWDSCILWGEARIVDTTEGRRALWDRMGYDLRPFEPGGPEADSHVFVLLRPTRAAVYRMYGIKGRFRWRAA
jgi:nitroimidazol reductase NimA-like FMN-containing flavoprotein (pyridoxamine 5'-phosphate oxidase superfamily)